MSSKRRHPSKPRGPAPPTRSRWKARVLLAVGAPLLFLLLVEGTLRMAGYGYPTSFFLSREVNGQPAWVENGRFGWRFFPRVLTRYPYPLVMAKPKPAGTTRIFVLGESAALGVPAPEFGFSRMLGVLLCERFPDQRFEVINVSMVAINSHVILPIARECARHHGDLWVIYMGNNEVVGPFGAQSVFGASVPPLPIIHASLALKTTRFGQLFDAIGQRIRGQAGVPPQWQGMQMWKTAIARDDPRIARVHDYFRQNLKEILNAGRQSGTPIILSTVACNLKDCSPFASLHRSGLTPAQQAEWDRAYQGGLTREGEGQIAEALVQYQRALELDDCFAELQFRAAVCCYDLGKTNEALQHFRLAKDEDALQFRSDSRLNDIIRQAAADGPSGTVRLLDAEELFARHSAGGIPGQELFYEHVHLTPSGNYLLARAVAELAAGMLPVGKLRSGTNPPPPWLSEAECEARLGLTDWGRLQTLQRVEQMLAQPPFTQQSNHSNQIQWIHSELRRFHSARYSEGLRIALRQVQAAADRNPTDPELLKTLAPMLEASGDPRGAEQRWREVTRLMPQAAIPFLNLAQLVGRQGRNEEAVPIYEECLRRDPDNFEAHGDLGGLYLRQGKPAEALPHLRFLVQRQPSSVDGHWMLAQALLRTDRRREAIRQFQEILRMKPDDAEAKRALDDLRAGK